MIGHFIEVMTQSSAGRRPHGGDEPVVGAGRGDGHADGGFLRAAGGHETSPGMNWFVC